MLQKLHRIQANNHPSTPLGALGVWDWFELDRKENFTWGPFIPLAISIKPVHKIIWPAQFVSSNLWLFLILLVFKKNPPSFFFLTYWTSDSIGFILYHDLEKPRDHLKYWLVFCCSLSLLIYYTYTRSERERNVIYFKRDNKTACFIIRELF